MATASAPRTSVMVIGEYNVGKTHYGAQLLQRLNAHTSSLRMRGAAENLKPFEAALLSINNGLAADHTAATLFVDSVWPVTGPDGDLDIVWPEYGGEQINEALASRRLSATWRARANESDGWIILTRAINKEPADDFLSRPLTYLQETKQADLGFRQSTQARMVELLQMLSFHRGQGNEPPHLCILLTCWDELPGDLVGRTPAEIMQRHLPLLHNYVDSNWPAALRSVMGLSALEKSLDPKDPDVEFRERGPDTYGYVVDESGARQTDLCLPLARVAKWRARA